MLENYVRAGYPAIAITTPEEDRALAEAKSVADRLNMGFATWSSTKSLQVDGKTQSVTDPVSALMAAHTVTALNSEFDSGPLGSGDSFTHVFNTSGTYQYKCSIHPYMTGEVIVQ